MPKMKNITKVWDIRSSKKVWTSTFWPMANISGEKGGNPIENLWADDGPLDKFDQVLKSRGKPVGAKAHESVPSLNWLKDPKAPEGYYVAKDTIRENDAEVTTGVSFSGKAKLAKGVKVDFLDDFSNFGENGKTNGSMDVSWWGSCDAVALAGMLFETPKKSVTINGVTFTPNDIKGLLVVTAQTQAGREEYVAERFDGLPDSVRLKNGKVLEGTVTSLTTDEVRTGKFTRSKKGNFVTKTDITKDIQFKDGDGKTRTLKAGTVASITREDDEALTAALFHKTVKTWLRQNRPIAMDHDPGPHVWNDNFDGAHIEKSETTPAGVKRDELNGSNGNYSGGRLCFYNCKLYKDKTKEKEFTYWIEKKGGKDVNSGWIFNGKVDSNPDFLWRTANKSSTGFVDGKNGRNPFVLPKLVEEIHKKSI